MPFLGYSKIGLSAVLHVKIGLDDSCSLSTSLGMYGRICIKIQRQATDSIAVML